MVFVYVARALTYRSQECVSDLRAVHAVWQVAASGDDGVGGRGGRGRRAARRDRRIGGCRSERIDGVDCPFGRRVSFELCVDRSRGSAEVG